MYPEARPIVSIGADNTLYESALNLVGATPIDVNADRGEFTPAGFVVTP